MSSPFNNNTRSRGRGAHPISRGSRGRGCSTVSIRPKATTRGNYLVEKEGDTLSPNGIGRRAFVKNLPIHTTFNDIKLFFGPKNIEGIAKFSTGSSMHAYVQFKYPSMLTEALEKDGDHFYDKPIVVRRYDDLAARNNSNNLRDSSSGGVDHDFKRSSKVIAPSPKRSRSNSPSSDVSSLNENHFDKDEQEPLQTTENITDAIPKATPSNNQDRTEEKIEKTLPQDVESSLLLVLSKKSAKMLSVPQLNKIIRYFKSEKPHHNGQESEEETDHVVPVDDETRKMIEKCMIPFS